MVSVRKPPASTIALRRKMPKAPETINSAFIADIATRPLRNARRYSTTWKRASQSDGSRTSVTRPASTVQPLTIRMTPPTATVEGPR